MKLCPYCAEEIQAAAIKCKHCGSSISILPRLQEPTPVAQQPRVLRWFSNYVPDLVFAPVLALLGILLVFASSQETSFIGKVVIQKVAIVATISSLGIARGRGWGFFWGGLAWGAIFVLGLIPAEVSGLSEPELRPSEVVFAYLLSALMLGGAVFCALRWFERIGPPTILAGKTSANIRLRGRFGDGTPLPPRTDIAPCQARFCIG